MNVVLRPKKKKKEKKKGKYKFAKCHFQWYMGLSFKMVTWVFVSALYSGLSLLLTIVCFDLLFLTLFLFVFHRYVLDGFPMTKKQVELMHARSIIPVRIINLGLDSKDVMIRGIKDRLAPTRCEKGLQHRFQWFERGRKCGEKGEDTFPYVT